MNTREIQKIRRKFIAVAMLSFFLVALFIGVFINVVNYYLTQREIDYSLEYIFEVKDALESEGESMEEIEEGPSFFDVFSPSYRTGRYYIFTFDEDGREVSFFSSGGNINSENNIRQKAESLHAYGAEKGRSGLYYYQKEIYDDGSTVLVLMNCSETIYARARLLYLTMVVGIAALLIAFVLVVVLSGKLIRPEIEMSEKQMKFLTNVSHELKTPLAVIRSNAEMEEILNGENEWTRSTIRQVDRMNGLIQNLVMITKLREIENDKIILDFDLSDVVADTAKEFAAMAEAEGKSLELAIEENISFSGEESKMRQLVMILLDNAVKYCDEGGSISVDLAKQKRGRIKLSVSNSYADGEGIDCTRFFDRFYREDESRNIDTGGYGIGLSIAASIVEQCRGKIRAEWSEGRITFICEL